VKLGKPVIPDWVESILVDPITKQPINSRDLHKFGGLVDTRVFLKNTHGYSKWSEGQEEFENWEARNSASHIKKTSRQSMSNIEKFESEILYDKPIYENFKISGKMLDVGGSSGMVRQHLGKDVLYVSIDPNPNAPFNIDQDRLQAYSCLSEDFAFICGAAEFLPFAAGSFDWVHMRSMLDHVQVPDLALLEANRILTQEGSLLIGISIEGNTEGIMTLKEWMIENVRGLAKILRIKKWQDHHLWHPTVPNLKKLITDNGFQIAEMYWQPIHKNKVLYVKAKKTNSRAN
jgi:ubiquinone/menaquinone biosynthesis C-methylase UbiE